MTNNLSDDPLNNGDASNFVPPTSADPLVGNVTISDPVNTVNNQTLVDPLPIPPIPVVNPITQTTPPLVNEPPTMTTPPVVSSATPTSLPLNPATTVNIAVPTPPLSVNDSVNNVIPPSLTPVINSVPITPEPLNETPVTINPFSENYTPVAVPPLNTAIKNPLPLVKSQNITLNEVTSTTKPISSLNETPPLAVKTPSSLNMTPSISDQPITGSVTSTQPIITELSNTNKGGALPPLSINTNASSINGAGGQSSITKKNSSFGKRLFKFFFKIFLFFFFIVIVIVGIIGYLQVNYPNENILQKVTSGDIESLMNIFNKSFSGKTSDSQNKETPLNVPTSYTSKLTENTNITTPSSMIDLVITTITQGTYGIESTGQVILKDTKPPTSVTNVDEVITYLQQGKTKAFIFTKQGLSLLRNNKEKTLLVSHSTQQFSDLKTPQLTNVLLPLFDEGYPILALIKSLQDNPQGVKKVGPDLWETSLVIGNPLENTNPLTVQFTVDIPTNYITSIDFVDSTDPTQSLGKLTFNYNAINTITLDKIMSVPKNYDKVVDTKLYVF